MFYFYFLNNHQIWETKHDFLMAICGAGLQRTALTQGSQTGNGLLYLPSKYMSSSFLRLVRRWVRTVSYNSIWQSSRNYFDRDLSERPMMLLRKKVIFPKRENKQTITLNVGSIILCLTCKAKSEILLSPVSWKSWTLIWPESTSWLTHSWQ